ncbi:MAG TPA: N-acetyltransferase [Oceanithermus profundus]|uniref:N-acetyltransferase n=1 Tax=Oceanithermus profundus TaxID=187137 RepID=A0A7C4VH93_9DEIN|nr:N-acetyltransferase [Oceanithermus profundus]
MRLPEELTTPRLRLRRPRADDAAFLHTLFSDPEVVRFLSFRPLETREDARGILERWRLVWRQSGGELPAGETGASLTYVVQPTGEGPIGTLSVAAGRYGYELAYALARFAWGRGYMPEAVKAMSDWLLSHGVWRVFATCHVDNVGSQRALEKAGFEREGRMRRYFTFPNLGPEPADGYLYARVREPQSGRATEE